jgi:LEM-3-like GIY-YIG domain
MARIHIPTQGTMATSPILAFIDSRTNQAQRKAKSAIMMKKEKGPIQCGGPSGGRQQSAAYIYAIIVDGVVRYIGKGRNGRMYTHLMEAKRTSARCPARTAHLYPRMHRKLVETVRAGSRIIEAVITSGLTDRAAYRLESRMIGEFHKYRAGQLWNTIDERFLDPRYLPDEWDDPENPLYRLPRPLGNPQLARGWARSKTYQLWARLAQQKGGCAAATVVEAASSNGCLSVDCRRRSTQVLSATA